MALDPGSGDRMYRRLGVPLEASAEQIDRAYRRLAHGAHPDAHPEDPDASRRFREITEAYEILGDPARRARYDLQRQPASPPISTPSTGRPVTRMPSIIGRSLSGTGSAPLIAGPVHIASPSSPHGVSTTPNGSADLAQLLELLLQPWRWW